MNKLLVIITSVLLLTACDKPESPENDKKVSQAELNNFIKDIKTNLVFVEGGDFEMGDFGGLVFGQQIDPDSDSKPLHKIELSGFSISKLKITNKEYDFYLASKGLKRREGKKSLQKWFDDLNVTPNTPAHIDWYEAESYCNWLGEITKKPFSLPTEAQWEYAARSRGKFLSVATNTGKAEVEHRIGGKDKGINIATSFDRESYSKKVKTILGSASSLPGDYFPPNPLGVYDMSANGYEWVKDWYDPDYYKNSPSKDPQGPTRPTYKYKDDGYQKVVRSSDRYNGIVGSVVDRSFRHPRVTENDYFLGDMTARCVVNTPIIVND